MRWTMSLGVVVLWTGPGAWGGTASENALARLQQARPRAQVYADDTRVTRVYGSTLSTGASPRQSAAQFVANHGEVFGVAAEDLRPGNPFNGRHTQPVMYDAATGTYRFTLVYYTQVAGPHSGPYGDGLPVYESELRLLVRNEADYPLVWVGSSLHELGDFEVPAGAARAVDENLAFATAAAAKPNVSNFSDTELVVWAGTADDVAAPTLALTFVGDNGLTGTSSHERYRFVADAAKGTLRHVEDLIVFTEIGGSVSGQTSWDAKAPPCGLLWSKPMPYAYVGLLDGEGTFADVSGDFVLTVDSLEPVTLESAIAGLYFWVYGASPLMLTAEPPDPVDFEHNDYDEYVEEPTAEINAYIQANVVRDFVLVQNPEYPTIFEEYDFQINVNMTGGHCPGNAWYDGYAINFCLAGGGYPNTAFAPVIHHEYGHHSVKKGGSGQGQYGEGMSDCLPMLIEDDHVMGYGFSGDCYTGLRDADNDLQYPCYAEIHYCGQLLSGAVWSTRNELVVTEPEDYLDILSAITVNSILLHTGDEITPQITIDFLTLDDDDDTIGNGTPHYAEINAGFGAHNMWAPELTLIDLTFPGGRPELLDPAGGTQTRLEVVPLDAEPLPGSALFYCDVGEGWVAGTMTEVAPNVYDIVFPPAECGASVKYYFTAETTDGRTVAAPKEAPNPSFVTLAAYDATVALDDDFTVDLGWTVENSPYLSSGAWERGIPVGSGERGDPPTDYDGSEYCYVTGNGFGDDDVDGMYTRLISPTLDVAGGDATVSYALWYTNDFGSGPDQDIFRVHVSNNDGVDWTLAQEHGPETSPGWAYFAFRVGDFVEATSTMRVRFEASDVDGSSVVEAGIDTVRVAAIDCTPFTRGDLNCDGAVDFFDIDAFVTALTDQGTYDAEYPECNWRAADCNWDGHVDFFDIESFVGLISAGE